MSVGLVGALAAGTAAFAAVLALVLRDVRPPRIRVSHPDSGALRDAGWERGLAPWEGIRLAISVVAFLVAEASGIPLVLAFLGPVAPSLWIRARAETARTRARRSFGRGLASIESALRAGLALSEALRRGADTMGDALASRPLLDALRAFELGASLDSALSAAALRCADDRTSVALTSLSIGLAERLPRARLAELVAAVADRAAFEDRLDEEVRARAAGARQQQWLLTGIVPALAIYLSMTMPSLATTLTSDLGRFVLIPSALALEVIGLVLGRRVMSGART